MVFLLGDFMYFRNKYFFMSNMYPCEIKEKIDNVEYIFTCVESAYQANKCPKRAGEFVNLDGFQAKKLGKEVELRSDWADTKVAIMRKLVACKFSNPELREKLNAVQGEIVETNYWGDTFWGKCYGKGENMMGKILMEIRGAINDKNI